MTVDMFIEKVSLWKERGRLDSELLKSITPYILTTHLDQDCHGKTGCLLSQFIEGQGDDSQLQNVQLQNYSMPDSKWIELFHFP